MAELRVQHTPKLGGDSFPSSLSSRMDSDQNELKVPVGTELCPGFAAGVVVPPSLHISEPFLPLSPLSLSRRILAQDGVAEAVRRSRYYEKPCRARRRRAFEACRRVYSAEMARRIAFLARSSRQDPWLGC